MIEIFRAVKPEIAMVIVEHIPECDTHDKIVDAMELYDQLRLNPECVCVIVAFDDNKLVGFVYGDIPSNRNYVRAVNMWVSNNYDIFDELDKRFTAWCKEKGFNRILMTTQRAKGFMRKYELKHYADILERVL